MNKLLIFSLIAGSMLSACSKSKTNPTPASNSVTINGTSYPTAVIGTQTWTTLNYNGAGGVNYNNSSNNPTFGKLYLLSEAQSIALPTGWRLPTATDAETLVLYLGATGTGIYVDGEATVSIKLKSTSDWTYTEGNNSSGFNAYPAGEDATSGIGASATTPTYSGINELTEFWTSTADSYSDQYLLDINNELDGPNTDNSVGIDYTYPPYSATSRYSIRFVKDN